MLLQAAYPSQLVGRHVVDATHGLVVEVAEVHVLGAEQEEHALGVLGRGLRVLEASREHEVGHEHAVIAQRKKKVLALAQDPAERTAHHVGQEVVGGEGADDPRLGGLGTNDLLSGDAFVQELAYDLEVWYLGHDGPRSRPRQGKPCCEYSNPPRVDDGADAL